MKTLIFLFGVMISFQVDAEIFKEDTLKFINEQLDKFIRF